MKECDIMYILEIKDLYFSYGNRQVLRGINLKVDKSKMIGIIGANGSGKTTLLKNISGYLKPEKGSVLIFGKNIKGLSVKERAKLIGYVPQDIIYDFDFTCYDIVMMGRIPYLRRFQTEGKEDREIVKEAMEMTNTWQFKDKLVKELSGGERQRVYIARALAQRPRILLMDEPVSHLDIKYQIEILSIAKELSSKGILVISVLHDINLASQFCDEIILIREGTIMAQGKPKEVITFENIKLGFSIDVQIFEDPFTRTPYVIPSLNGKEKLKVV
jgi:iron complex transport system ATP-binding protein